MPPELKNEEPSNLSNDNKRCFIVLGQPIYLRQWYGRSVPWRFRLASQGTESWSLPRNFFEGLKEGKEKDVMI